MKKIIKWWKKQDYWKKGTYIGIVIGIIFTIINMFLSGILGYFLLYPLFYLIDFLFGFEKLFNCYGERCWIYIIYIGSIGFIMFTPPVFGFITHLISKLKK